MSKPIVLKIKTIGLSIKTSSVVECHYFYKKQNSSKSMTNSAFLLFFHLNNISLMLLTQ